MLNLRVLYVYFRYIIHVEDHHSRREGIASASGVRVYPAGGCDALDMHIAVPRQCSCAHTTRSRGSAGLGDSQPAPALWEAAPHAHARVHPALWESAPHAHAQLVADVLPALVVGHCSSDSCKAAAHTNAHQKWKK